MLKPIKGRFTIVLAGLWNTQIFHARWLAAHVFETEPVELQVPTVPGLPQRFRASGVIVSPEGHQVILAPEELETGCIEKMERMAGKTVALLPHTPFHAVGFNYGFKMADTDEKLLNHFEDRDIDKFSDAGYRRTRYQIVRKLESDTSRLYFTAQLSGADVEFHFNYHTDTPDAQTALGVLEQGRFWSLLQESRHLLQFVYGLDDSEGDHE
ncbi:MAG: hypothetical protein ACPGUV_07980 [Polyangiales bacterium]